jgi:hypothetical protein
MAYQKSMKAASTSDDEHRVVRIRVKQFTQQNSSRWRMIARLL